VVKKWKDPKSGAPNPLGAIAIDIGVWCEFSIPIVVREFTISTFEIFVVIFC
jgi:hypothetical protein